MSFAMVTLSMRSEVAWWGRGLAWVVRRWPGQVAVLGAVAWFCPTWLTLEWTVFVGMAVVLLRVCALRSPTSFHRWLLAPSRRLVWRIRLGRCWRDSALACGLGRPSGRRHGSSDQVAKDVREVAPQLTRITTDGPRVTLHVRPLVGQTVESFTGAGEQLRMAMAATRVRVDPEGVNRVAVTFTMSDWLGEPFVADRPHVEADWAGSVPMGRCEDGSTWRLPVGPHTLVAGMSGAGKGSVFWSFAFGLAPDVRAGTVRLHGIDLKGGMEVLMGAKLFATRATDAGEAVAVLERLVGLMRERTRFYAGRVRSHVPSVEEPLHVVMVDELAALTAYCPERDLQRRAEMAINLLCSQGRAPGFVVFACLQDPRKEVIPSRGLFTQMVGLRLKDATETSMVLGDSAVSSGAACHRITRATPGLAYVVPEDGGYPLRVRAGYVPDSLLRSVAAEFAAPGSEPVAPVAALDSSRSGRAAGSSLESEVA
jgi:S-DNA-T family DNA segregation ATPase FtsK/SpoIIIE